MDIIADFFHLIQERKPVPKHDEACINLEPQTLATMIKTLKQLASKADRTEEENVLLDDLKNTLGNKGVRLT